MTTEELIERIENLVGELEGLKTGYAEKLAAKQKEIDTLVDLLEDDRAKMEKVIPLIEDSTKKVEGIEDIAARSAVVEKQSQDMEKQIEEARKLADKINGFEATMDEARSEMTESQQCFQDDRARLEELKEKEVKFEKQLEERFEGLEEQLEKRFKELEQKIEGMGTQEKSIIDRMSSFDKELEGYKCRMEDIQKGCEELAKIEFSIGEPIKKEFWDYVLENLKLYIEPIMEEFLAYVLRNVAITGVPASRFLKLVLVKK